MSKLFLIILIILARSPVYASESVQALIGGELVQLPIPAGFGDPKNSAPVLHSNAERLTPPHLKLLAVYVPDADISAVRSGTTPKFDNYFMAYVLRGKETESVDAKGFAAVKLQIRGAPKVEDQKQVRAKVQQHIASVARDIGSKTEHSELALTIGESRQLEIFNETASSLSMLAVSGVEGTDGFRKYVALGSI